MKHFLLTFLLLTILSCSKEADPAPEVDKVLRSACTTEDLESQMNKTLSALVTDTDFSLSVERSDGRKYTFNKGAVTQATKLESASTSKLVTTVILLRLVDQGVLQLSDKPQTYITSWPVPVSDPLYNINLSQLLNFTSGLENEALCLNAGAFNFENCVINTANINIGNGAAPGAKFYYSGSHLQVAGLMAIKAKNVSSWQDIFTAFKNETGLFSTSAYDLPSSSNPRLAGGMHWTGSEYLAFLKALKSGTLLSPAMFIQLTSDQTSNVIFGYSPVVAGINEDWHFGFGIWHECQSSTYNCSPGTRMSNPGAYGAYPFWDKQKNYFGIVARQGALGTYKNGLAVERAVRATLDDWATCAK